MNKLKVLSIFGTRPEAIKMAPLCIELAKRPEFDAKICVTAQHRGMLDTVMEDFSFKADFDLDIMTNRQTLCGITAKIMAGLEGVFAQYRPDICLVHGDTSTTAVSALGAFYSGVKVGHVEAGLRTYDKYSPYPEEVNRMVTGDIADLHFAPTIANAENLIKENIKENVFITGNTVIDALKYTVSEDYEFKNSDVLNAAKSGKKIIMLTAHRRENLGTPHREIFTAVKRLAAENPEVIFVYPVHPNPAVLEPAEEILGGSENVLLTSPLDTKDAHNLMNRSLFIMTDSGGLQEEGPALGKPVLVLRAETERPEAVAAGTVKLSGIKSVDIYNDAAELLKEGELYKKMAHAVNPYGDGNASKRIADALLHVFLGGPEPDKFN